MSPRQHVGIMLVAGFCRKFERVHIAAHDRPFMKKMWRAAWSSKQCALSLDLRWFCHAGSGNLGDNNLNNNNNGSNNAGASNQGNFNIGQSQLTAGSACLKKAAIAI